MDPTLLATNITTDLLQYHDNPFSPGPRVNIPSPTNTLTPLTPPLDREGAFEYELRGLPDKEGSWTVQELYLASHDPSHWFPMSPGKTGTTPALGYNESYQTPGVSQERSTVSPGQSTSSEPVSWPPKLPTDTTFNAQPTGQNMLPPLRSTAQDSPLPSTQYWSHYQTNYAAYPQAYPLPQYPPSYRVHGQHNYGYPSTQSYGHSPHHSGFATYAYPHHTSHPSSSTSNTDLLTPATAPPFYGSGTIQPSAFGGWHSADASRRESTVSGSMTGGGDLINNRLAERHPSSTSLSEQEETLVKVEQELNPLLSPDSPGNSTDSEGERTPAPAMALMVHEGGIMYTMDAEIKQTPEIKRMCFNCQSKSPPSWRKSVLNVGKILCNKCGIFERTHHRPRPPQNDDQKLRKGGSIPYGRPMRDMVPLQTMSGDESPMHSPYSVPSQGTPLSATGPSFSQFAFEFPQTHHPGAYDTPSLSHRRHSQVHPHSYGHQTSPYAHAYARRAASSTAVPMVRSPVHPPTSAGLQSSGSMSQGLAGWQTPVRNQEAGFPANSAGTPSTCSEER